jgi:hypothetical protein
MGRDSTIGCAFQTALSTLIEQRIGRLNAPNNSFKPKPLRGSLIQALAARQARIARGG